MRNTTPRRLFITGASSGIGRALALEYARGYGHERPKIGLLARRRELLEEVAAQCRRHGADPFVYVTDVCDFEAVRQAANGFLEAAGGADLVIANAGGSSGGQREQSFDPEPLDQTLRLNVSGVAATLAPFLPAMKAARKGQLSAVASLAGFRGSNLSAAYAASKAGLISWMEALRVSLYGTGVQVSTICPGFIRTPLSADVKSKPWLMEAEQAARIIRRELLKRRSLIAFPWQTTLLVRIVHLLPNAVYDPLAARWGRK